MTPRAGSEPGKVPALLGASIGTAMVFVLTTVVMDQVSDAVLVAAALVIAAALAAVLLDARSVLAGYRAAPRQTVVGALGGVAALWAAPLLVLTQRASDAPSGAVVLFHTTALWGVIAAASWWVSPRKSTSLAFAGAVVSAVGGAAILANWERPSSFSPFVKYPMQESLMLLAGVVFVAGSIAVVRAARASGDARHVTLAAILAAAVVAAVVATPTASAALPALSRLSAEFVLLGVATYGFAWGWLSAVDNRGVASGSVALLIAPVVMTLLSVVERSTGVWGPNPILWDGALAGAGVCVAGAVVVFGSIGPADDTRPTRIEPRTLLGARVLAAVGLAAGVVALFLPALGARSVGVMPVPFDVSWSMLGYETAVGWLPVAGAGVVLVASLLAPLRITRISLIAASIASLVTAFVYPSLGETPLHTWNNWVPSDVQQTYGTEYARFTVQAMSSPVGQVALAISVVAALLLLASTLVPASVKDSHDASQ